MKNVIIAQFLDDCITITNTHEPQMTSQQCGNREKVYKAYNQGFI